MGERKVSHICLKVQCCNSMNDGDSYMKKTLHLASDQSWSSSGMGVPPSMKKETRI